MGTIVTYNDIVIYNAQTREFRQEIVYDPSRTDRLFSRYTMTFEGIVTPQQPATTYIGAATAIANRSTAQDWFSTIRLALAENRRPLVVTQHSWIDGRMNARSVFRCVPASTHSSDPDRDLGNGPKPMELRIMSVLGSQAYQVQWTVQCEKLESPNLDEQRFLDQYEDIQPVLVNRWSVSEEFDENLFCTRTISGSLRMSLPAAQTGFDYRWLAVPGLEAGFKRQRMRYAVQPDGLEVQYEIQDRQYHTMPPWPCTDMRIRHSRSTNYGVTALARCEVQLSGSPDVPKTALLARLIQIMDYYLGILRNVKTYAQTWHIRNATIVEEIGPANQVAGQIEIQILGSPKESGDTSNNFLTQHMLSVGRDLDLSDQTIPQVPGRTPPETSYHPCLAEMPSPFGYTTWGGERNPAVIALFQCYLQRPYRPPHGMANWPAPKPDQAEQEEKDKTQVQRVQPEELSLNRKDQYSEEHKKNLYTYVRMKNIYRIHRMRVGCPKAKISETVPEKTVHIVQLAEDVVRRTVLYDAERLGAWPELPQPIDYPIDNGAQSAHAILKRYSVLPFPPTVSPTGEGLIYRVQAKYLWLLEKPLSNEKPWPLGHLPHVDDQQPGFLPKEAFQERIGPK